MNIPSRVIDQLGMAATGTVAAAAIIRSEFPTTPKRENAQNIWRTTGSFAAALLVGHFGAQAGKEMGNQVAGPLGSKFGETVGYFTGAMLGAGLNEGVSTIFEHATPKLKKS